LMRWISIGRKLNNQKSKINRGYALYRKFYLDEKSDFYQSLKQKIKNKEDFIANLGHSTIFISYKGVKVLTDPFLSPHIFGIKRQKPAILPYLLPQMDYILISHAHYDHLDLRTLRRLHRGAVVILPQNTAKVLGNMYFRGKVELAHYASFKEKDTQIISLPVKHNKGRSILYPNTQVSSYFFKIKDKTFYFGGDSAYFEGYKNIGENFKINYAFLPIGGYEPRLLLRNVHMNPKEAVQAFLDLKADFVVPVHYGTYHTFPKFVKVEAPLKRFLEEVQKTGIEKKLKVVMPNTVEIL